MDVKLIQERRVILGNWGNMRGNHKRKLRRKANCCVAVLTGAAERGGNEGTRNLNTVYTDNWFDKLAIDHLSEAVQATSGDSF